MYSETTSSTGIQYSGRRLAEWVARAGCYAISNSSGGSRLRIHRMRSFVQVVDKSWSRKEKTVGSVALRIKDLRMLTGHPVRRLREHNIINTNGDGTLQTHCK